MATEITTEPTITALSGQPEGQSDDLNIVLTQAQEFSVDLTEDGTDIPPE